MGSPGGCGCGVSDPVDRTDDHSSGRDSVHHSGRNDHGYKRPEGRKADGCTAGSDDGAGSGRPERKGGTK